MKKVLQTRDKRTVRRRLARLRARASEWGITPWVSRVEEKLPQLIGSVGSARLPSTTNAVERFFRAFQRFYRTRGGFHSVLSAKRELLLFFVVYVFTQHATTGQAPIEVIVPEARRMPLYRLINDPFRALQERGNVKRQAHDGRFAPAPGGHSLDAVREIPCNAHRHRRALQTRCPANQGSDRSRASHFLPTGQCGPHLPA